jgi:ubiquinone/menaquinone biosynthesis C-methylase UbiE
VEPRFNRYEHEYEELVERSIGWSGADHAFFVQAKASHLLRLVRQHIGDPGRAQVLDVGCGIGLIHRYLGDFGELHGADVSETSIARARRENPQVAYTVAEAASLPMAEAAFDVTFSIGMLHHMSPSSRDPVLAEFARVTRTGGLVVVFEHNPLNPLTRLAVLRCEFDDDAILLGPAELRRRLTHIGLLPIDQRYIIFFPRRGRALRRAENAIRRLPLGAQYYVAATK